MFWMGSKCTLGTKIQKDMNDNDSLWFFGDITITSLGTCPEVLEALANSWL